VAELTATGVLAYLLKPLQCIVVVDFIDRNENIEQRDKQDTLLSICKNTANAYKSTISQDNNHQAKFKLTQKMK